MTPKRRIKIALSDGMVRIATKKVIQGKPYWVVNGLEYPERYFKKYLYCVESTKLFKEYIF